MLTILNLFGRSPFAPLQSHMESVAHCVHMLPALFAALENKDYQLLESISEEICELKHNADLIKNKIRKHLPRSLYLPIDRGNLLEILSIQDRIVDKAKDIGVLITLKHSALLPTLQSEFKHFLDKNIETFDGAFFIIKELNDLVESSFGGIEAKKVRLMVDTVIDKEHEVDLIQRALLTNLFNAEDQMTYMTFYQWQRLFETIAAISNLAENLADRVRMMLELK